MPFNKERQKTDKSLRVERVKADNSLERINESAEGKTDKALETVRKRDDEARERRAASTENHEKIQTEDREREVGRAKVDSALDEERGEKERHMALLLTQEREQTDKNLSGERNQTDQEVERAATTLKREQTEHSKTKSALTTREEFVAIVSHDLRNPIGTILSASEILLDEESDLGICDKSKKWIEIIERSENEQQNLSNLSLSQCTYQQLQAC